MEGGGIGKASAAAFTKPGFQTLVPERAASRPVLARSSPMPPPPQDDLHRMVPKAQPPIRVAVPCRNTLGEGPVWDDRTDHLWWVDIEQSQLLRFHPGSGELREWSMPERLCAVGLRHGPGLVLALASHLTLFDPDNGRFEHLPAPLDHPKQDRFNDAFAAPGGFFFAGTMVEGSGPGHAGLYRLDPDGSQHRVLEGFSTVNGLAWSPDAGTMYLSDTPRGLIQAYDYDQQTGAISRSRTFFETNDQPGEGPDGAVVDAEGFLWSCLYGGGRLIRINPQGQLDHVLEVPVACPTRPAFGGPDLLTLYVTSARQGLDAAALAKQPWAGSVLAMEPGVAGQKAWRFGG
jgi:sugar lactone lactonase YvrE